MAKINWTDRALNDLNDIGEFIAKDSLRYSKMTLEKLIETARLIEKNQMIGRVVPELNVKEIREIITGNYRIIYQISDSNIVSILTVHHCSRLLSSNPVLPK